MTTRERVLSVLASEPGEYFSGEELAASLGVTRASVWKAINALRREGYPIGAVTNRGYSLYDGDILTAGEVSGKIGDLPIRVEVHKTLPSTNTYLKERAAAGEGEGLLVIAGEQTEGRGRRGREFVSPPGTGLYMSLLLRPRLDPGRAQLLTALAAVSAAEAGERLCGKEIKIKWVNDLFLNNRKVCGILTEAVVDLETGGMDYAVLGLGFNIAPPEGGWGPLSGVAGSLFSKKPEGMVRASLAGEFVREFYPMYRSFRKESFLKKYRQRQLVPGHMVEIITPGKTPERALAVGVDDEFRLIVRFEDGREQALNAGEVRLLPKLS